MKKLGLLIIMPLQILALSPQEEIQFLIDGISIEIIREENNYTQDIITYFYLYGKLQGYYDCLEILRN